MHEPRPDFETDLPPDDDTNSAETVAGDPQVGPENGAAQAEIELDEFLKQHAGVFEAVNRAWRSVAEGQRDVHQAFEVTMPPPAVTYQQSVGQIMAATGRGKRSISSGKLADRMARAVNNQSNIFVAEAAETGYRLARDIAPGVPEEDDQALRSRISPADIGAALQKSPLETRGRVNPAEVQKLTADQLSDVHATTGLIDEQSYELTARYAVAYYRQERAFALLEGYLRTHPGSGEAFVTRLADLDRDAKRGYAEFPGLLEIAATRVGDVNRRQDLLDIIEADRIDREGLKAEVIRLCFEAPDRLTGAAKRELAPMIIGMRFVAETVDAGPADTGQSLIDQLAERYDAWPGPLKEVYETWLKAHATQTKARLREILAPYIEQQAGRQQPKVLSTAMSAAAMLGAALTTVPARRKGRTKKSPHQPEVMSLDDLARITGDEEVRRQPAITSFGTLRHVSGGRIYGLEPAGDVDTLMQQPAFSDYMAKYVSEKDLPDALWLFATHISENPMDRENSRRMRRGASIELIDAQDDETQTVGLRVFEPRTVQGVASSNVIRRTRIIYGIAKVNDRPTLVVSDVRLRRSEDKY